MEKAHPSNKIVKGVKGPKLFIEKNWYIEKTGKSSLKIHFSQLQMGLKDEHLILHILNLKQTMAPDYSAYESNIPIILE